jgi:hypothetical protein
MNAFTNNNYAFIILEGYIMALIKTTDCAYVFDSHARNCYGMPDPNGTAVVMKFADIYKLEEYLCSISLELNSELFEIVPVEFRIHSIPANVTDAILYLSFFFLLSSFFYIYFHCSRLFYFINVFFLSAS